MFGSVRFWFGKQNFDWLVWLGSGKTVKHCFGRSLLSWKHLYIFFLRYFLLRLQFADFISGDIFRKLRRLTPSIEMYFSVFSNGGQKSVYNEEKVFARGPSMTMWTQICPFLTTTAPISTRETLNVDKSWHFWTTYHLSLST